MSSDKSLYPDRRDYALAGLLALLALAAYVRTLAPDVLYSDSAEFQTLAYTLGTTHSTGYPVYLLLARLVGFLPLRSPAWRISLFSALCAAVTVGGIYVLTRFVTRNRLGAALGSVALALSYTLWSQAIIAEVYTPATAFLVVIFILLAHWQRAPVMHQRALFFATALTCLSLGVHASVALMAPTAVIFVLWVLWAERETAWASCLRTAAVGFVVGLALYFLTFILLDLHNPPSSFIRVMLYPSRSIWGLQATDLDSVIERWWLTVTGMQWQDAMFPESGDFTESLVFYFSRIYDQEFSPWLLLCALLGINVLRWFVWKPSVDVDGQPLRAVIKKTFVPGPTLRLSAFMGATFVVMLSFVLNYYPGDKYIFYLPTYLFVAVATGAGIGRVLDWLQPQPEKRKRRPRYLYPLIIVALVWVVLSPYAESRWQALKAGTGLFVQDTYPYPLENLDAPRQHAILRLTLLPEDAFLVMNWRALYAFYYIAHVEEMRPNVIIKEATPHGSEGKIADTLIEEIEAALHAGRPVFVDEIYDGLRARFRVMPAPGGEVYRLTFPRGQGHE